jgi:hypothetical protein
MQSKYIDNWRQVTISRVWYTRELSVVGRACLPAKDICRIVASFLCQWNVLNLRETISKLKCIYTWFYYKESRSKLFAKHFDFQINKSLGLDHKKSIWQE